MVLLVLVAIAVCFPDMPFSDAAQTEVRLYDMCNEFSSKYYPDLVNSKATLETLSKVRQGLSGISDPNLLLQRIGETIYNDLKISTGRSVGDPGTLIVDSVLDQGKGNCVSISILYIVIAEELGLELSAACCPGHMYVVYEGSGRRVNIEVTDRGDIRTDADYAGKIPPSFSYNPDYNRTLSKKEILGVFLGNMLGELADQGRYADGLEVFEKARTLFPAHAAIYNNAACCYLRNGDRDEALQCLLYGIKLDPNIWSTQSMAAGIFLSKEQYGQARISYEKGVSLLFDEILFALPVKHLHDEGDSQAAAQNVLVSEHVNNCVSCCNAYANYYLRLEKYQLAVELLNKAKALEPDNADTSRLLMLAAYRTADLDLILQKKGELPAQPGNVVVGFHLDMSEKSLCGMLHGLAVANYYEKEFEKTIWLIDFINRVGGDNVENQKLRGDACLKLEITQ